MALQPITADFNRNIGSLMGQAQDSIHSVGQMAGDYLLKQERDADRLYQRGREKVQDDRLTIKFVQEQEAVQNAKNQSAAAAQFALANPYVASNGAQPPLEQSTSVEGPLLGTRGNPTTSSVEGTNGVGVSTSRVQGHYGKDTTVPASYSNANPSLQFMGKTTMPSTMLVKGTPEYTTENFKDKVEPVGNGNILQYTPDKHGRMSPHFSLNNFSNKLTTPSINALGNAIFSTNTKDALYDAAIKDRSLSTNIPASSARDLNTQGKALMSQFDDKVVPTTITTSKLMTTKLDNIDTSVAYDSNGHKFGDKLLPSQKNATEVYFKDKSGQMIKSTDYDVAATAKSNSYVPEARTAGAWMPGHPENTKYIAGTSAKTLPISSTTVDGTVKTSSVSTKEVVDTVNNAASSFSSIVNNGKPTTADQVTGYANKMRDYVMTQYPGLDFMQVSKMSLEAAKMQIPDGSMTAKETAAMNANAKDLERQHMVFDTNKKHGWDVDAAVKVQEGENGRFFEGLRSRERIANQEHEDKVATLAHDKFKPIFMNKPEGSGFRKVVANNASDVQSLLAQGFTPGVTEADARKAGLAGSGTSKIDLQAVGGRSNIGGTSGADLVTLSKRMKNEFKLIPQDTIDAEIQNLSQGWVSDSINIDALRKTLTKYK